MTKDELKKLNLTETQREILDIYIDIAKPYNEDIDNSPKTQAILKKIDKRYIVEYSNLYGLLVRRRDFDKNAWRENGLLIISHIDLIGLFNKAHQNGINISIDSVGSVRGSLDNTITNAVAIKILKDGIDKNSWVLFSLGEENGMWGVRNFLREVFEPTIIQLIERVDKNRFVINNKKSNYYSLAPKKLSVVNLDVTNDNNKFDASIEYDSVNSEVFKQIKLFCSKTNRDLKKNSVNVTTNRVCDDIDAIHSFNKSYRGNSLVNGLSVCLPTNGIIHSLENSTTLEKIEGYYNTLTRFIKEINLGNIELYKKPDKIKFYNIDF